MKNNFLFEIGCEELPPKSLQNFSTTLVNNIQQGLTNAHLTFAAIIPYATPRRLAVIVKDLLTQQPDQAIERKGPASTAPTAAIEGFLRSNNITAEQLVEENGRLVYRFIEKGKTIHELMPEIIRKALADLPIPKPMRWSDKTTQFIRPVHWAVMMHGHQIIPATILGLTTSNKTYGHRFHHPAEIELVHVDEYVSKLQHAKVVADFKTRKDKIIAALDTMSQSKNGNYLSSPELLDEVTSIVEWPVPLLCHFNEAFLTVPKEALISAMQNHQKCFAIQRDAALLPYFITISNIESHDQNTVIHGNERVMHARLSDAKFFYDTDCKTTLESRLETLQHIVFQAKLGTLHDKSTRIAKLAKFIAEKLQVASHLAERAGLLCKTDLVSNMVKEFPELQGIMGHYYALHDKEDKEITLAIRDQYKNPTNAVGYCVALADRIDTLTGIFGINQAPSGDKDPFGLRRAAIAVLKIIIEGELPLNLIELITAAQKNYQQPLPNETAVKQVHEFILERLPGLYEKQVGLRGANKDIVNIPQDTILAVLAVANHTIFDSHRRIEALQKFRCLPEAIALTEANKRASNLLKKSDISENFDNNPFEQIDSNLFQHASEQQLFDTLKTISIANADYFSSLKELATLQLPVANFFDHVMVMDENINVRNNRLAMLAALRQLFLQIADISLLQNSA